MVTFSDSFLAFICEQKQNGSHVASLIHNAIHNAWFKPVYNKVLTNKEVNYITMRPDGLLSYLPAGKEHKYNDRGEWSLEGRQSGKPAKVIRKVFQEKVLRFIKAKEFEAFGNAYKAKFVDNGFEFVVRPNVDIPSVYSMKRLDGDGSMNNSCMNDDADYLRMYQDCKALRIVTLINKDGLLCGRALLWNVMNVEQGEMTFMDRIYVVEDFMYDIFLNYASEQKWWRKVKFKTFSDKHLWVNPETEKSVCVEVKIKTATDFDYFPYIDTFTYGGDGYISNSGGEYTYECTDGSRHGGDEEEQEEDHYGEVWSDLDQEWINEDDAVYLWSGGSRRYRNQYTHVDNAREAYAGWGTNRQEWMHENDDCLINIGGEYYHIDHEAIIRTVDGDYDHKDNCTECVTDSEWYPQGDRRLIQDVDGDWHRKDNNPMVIQVQSVYTKTRTTHYLPDVENIVAEVNGKWYWIRDPRLVEMEVMRNGECENTHVFRLEVIKWGRQRYHKDDQRLIAAIIQDNTKRKAA